MQRWWRFALVLLVLALMARGWLAPDPPPAAGPEPAATVSPAPQSPEVDASWLPAEARETLRLIESGGPFPYDRDGTLFQNREGRLPQRPRGHYREYTVRTPGSRDRGARRIVAGGRPPAEFFYTDDHYRSFRRIEVAGK